MPTTPTIIETPGAADANSFATVAEYKTYWTAHLYNTKALAATDDQIAAALVQTGRALNALMAWTGSAASDTQSMTWPRNGMLTRNGFAIPNDVNPSDLKDAQCEWAGQYISGDLFKTNAIQAQGIAGAKAGPVAVTYQTRANSSVETMAAEFRRNLPELAWASTEVPDFVRNLLVPSWYTREMLQPAIVFTAHR